MSKETILYLQRMNVLASFDDQVFYPASNFDIAFFVHGCLVTSVHPQPSVFIWLQNFFCACCVAPVSFHYKVARYGEFAALTYVE